MTASHTRRPETLSNTAERTLIITTYLYIITTIILIFVEDLKSAGREADTLGFSHIF